MIRNVSVLRLLNGSFGARTSTSVQQQRHKSSKRSLSTKQKQQKEEIISDLDKFYSQPSEPGFVKSSPYENIVIPTQTMDQYVWNHFREWETKIATVCGVTDRKYTFAELRDHSAALALRLQQKFHMKKSDVLAICLPNVPEFPIATFGAIEAGLVVTTVNPIYTPEEISRQLTDSGAKMIVTTCEQYDSIKKACELAKTTMPIICMRTESKDEAMPAGAIDFGEIITPHGLDYNSLVRYDSNIEEVTLLPYSSGTTGLAKGVQLSHRNLTSNCEMLQAKTNQLSLIFPTTDTFQDVLPCVLPFFHIYGFTVTMASKLALGCQLVTLPKFHPETFLNSMAKYKGTVLHLVPPIVIFLGHHNKVEKKHVESIRNVMSGAAPMGATDAERFTARAPNAEFIQGYGLTESAPVVLMGMRGSKNYASVGEPTPNTQAKIVDLNDPTNTGLGPNQVGELLVRGPQVMKGYLNKPEATSEMLIENGWMRTGDMAYYDDNNQFYITDRLKELIKVKGFQVPPAELEEILRDHPKIIDAAVVGVPHKINGEVPRAFVVCKPNETVTEAELKKFVADKVAVYKKLDGGVQFLESIPKNASGKILRREIKLKYC